MAYYQSPPTQTQHATQQTSAINVPQQQRQSRARTSTTIPYDYQEQNNPQYSSHQSSALAVPPQPRQSTRPHTLSHHASSRGNYLEQQSGYPSSSSAYSTETLYSVRDDLPYDSGFLPAGPVNPAFPEPHPSAGGAIQRSHPGQYTSSTGTVRHSSSAHTANLYATTNSSVRRGPSTHSATLYPQVPGNTSVHHKSFEQAAAQHQDGYGYDEDFLPKSPAPGPVQGRSLSCRMPGCNRPMYFDRRFNEFWEWCGTQHIHEALGRGMERVCKHCAVWPRKYGFRYCGGDACNKRGVPL